MAETTGISWAHHTRNYWEGCTNVSPGCDSCYAQARDLRFHGGKHWGAGAPRLPHLEGAVRDVRRWARAAGLAGERRRIFVNSLSDSFDNEVPPEWRDVLFYDVECCPELDFLILTKRIANVARMATRWARAWPKNAWLGITVVNQMEADRDIPKLLEIPARVRWLSIEPQLGPVDLTAVGATRLPGRHWGWNVLSAGGSERINWVVVGGESGRNARPFILGWAKEIVLACQLHGVPVHVKQLGANPTNREGVPHPQEHHKGGDISEWPEVLRVREFPT